jgi:hypothetical protein
MAAAAFGCPELLLDDKEAQKLGNSIERVLALYATEVNPAAMAWAGLVFMLVIVYGPRWWAIRERWRMQKGAQPAPANVRPFPTPQQRAQAAAAPPAAAAAPPAAAAAPAPEAQQRPPEARDGAYGTPTDMFGVGYSAALAEPL